MDLFDLNQQLSIIEVSGPDAQSYLQGQITNDIRELAHKRWQLAAHLNPKGRILASFIIHQAAAECYYLITPTALASQILPRLKMFVLRSKVTVKLNPELFIYFSHQAQSDLINLKLGENGYLLIGTEQLAAQTNATAWHQFLVTHGMALIYPDTYEKIIPQQINYDLIDAINFKKGCYTGQEIVARTHYLGKTKRRLAHFTTTATPLRGQTVVSPLLDNQEVGFIIDFYPDNQVYHGLVSLQTNCIEAAFLDIANQQQLSCHLLNRETDGE